MEKCKYCMNGIGGESLNETDMELNLFVHTNTFLGGSYLYDEYCGCTTKPINFCPMCGRNLNDNESEE